MKDVEKYIYVYLSVKACKKPEIIQTGMVQYKQGEMRTGIMMPVLYSNLLATRVQADSQPSVSQCAATKPHS